VSGSACLAGGAGLFFALAALPAHAAISAQIPPECGSLSAFEQELEQRLGSVSAPETTRVTLTPEVDGYHLIVEAGDQRRELHDPSCQELLHAAVVIALALLEPKREEPPPPPPQPVRPTPPEQVAPPEPSVPKRRHPKFALGAGGGVHVGTLPNATLLLELDAQLKWTRFGVAAGLRYLLPSEIVDETGRGVRVGAAGASLAGLFEPWHRLQFRLGVATYRLSGSGIGGFAPRDGSAWEVAPTLGATFTPFERPPFWTALGLEAQFNLLRPSFEILHYYEVFQVPRLSGSAFARAGVVF
jgi:hypothetical protein